MRPSSPYLKRGVRLELTPLIDIMFLVLVFFVYAVFTMAVHRGVKVDLPAVQGAIERGERMVVTIDADDRLQLNGREVSCGELVGEVRRLASVRPDVPVLVSGDRRASLGIGVSLLSELKKTGVEKVSFQVGGPCGDLRQR